MSSIIEFRNLTFTGDQVTFDIHVNLPPGAGEWMGINLMEYLFGMNPHILLTIQLMVNHLLEILVNSGQIDIYSTGNNLIVAQLQLFLGPLRYLMILDYLVVSIRMLGILVIY